MIASGGLALMAAANMHRMEAMNGGTPMITGQTKPFPMPPLDAFRVVPVIHRRADDVRIVAIWFREEGAGHFKALVAAIIAAGLNPVVVEPMGRSMPDILRHWRWTGRRVEQPDGDVCEEWRP